MSKPKIIIKLKHKPKLAEDFVMPEFTPANYDPTTTASQLHTNGYIVLPFISNYKAMHPTMLTKFREMIASFPTIKNYDLPVLGGFAALGNPGSFHHPLIRYLREWSLSHSYPLFQQFEKNNGTARRLECLADRFMSRPPGAAPTAEHWHRDTTVIDTVEDGDDIFGGWINLDNRDQIYSAVPKTHEIGKPKGTGFEVSDKTEKAWAEKNKITIKIPPGHIVIFFQNMLHEVVAFKKKYTMHRLFTGFRLTKLKTPLISNIQDIISQQGVIPLKSGQLCPMYGKNHASIFLWRTTIPWSEKTFHLRCLETKISGAKTKKPNTKYQIVHRFMKSLESYGLQKYKGYAWREIELLRPAKIHKLLPPGTTNVVNIRDYYIA